MDGENTRAVLVLKWCDGSHLEDQDKFRTSGIVTLHNYMDFMATNNYLTIRYELNCDGEVLCSGNVDRVPAILPHAEGTIRLNIQVPTKGRTYL